MSEGMKKNIQAAIAATNDQNLRSLLLLLLGVLEEIGDKLDALVADDKHRDDHDWIEALRQSKLAEACSWAEQKMIEERRDNRELRKMQWDIRSTLITTAISISGTIIVLWLSGGRIVG